MTYDICCGCYCVIHKQNASQIRSVYVSSRIFKSNLVCVCARVWYHLLMKYTFSLVDLNATKATEHNKVRRARERMQIGVAKKKLKCSNYSTPWLLDVFAEGVRNSCKAKSKRKVREKQTSLCLFAVDTVLYGHSVRRAQFVAQLIFFFYSHRFEFVDTTNSRAISARLCVCVHVHLFMCECEVANFLLHFFFNVYCVEAARWSRDHRHQPIRCNRCPWALRPMCPRKMKNSKSHLTVRTTHTIRVKRFVERLNWPTNKRKESEVSHIESLCAILFLKTLRCGSCQECAHHSIIVVNWFSG